MIWKPLRNSFYTRSLSFRLYLIIIPITILSVGLIDYLDERMAGRMLDDQVERSTALVASQLAQDLSSEEALKDPETVRRWLGELLEANFHIVRIDLYRLTGDGIVRITSTSTSGARPITIDELTAAREARMLVIPQYQERERYLKVIAPIAGSRGALGCVSVTSSLRQSDLVSEVHSKIALFLIPGAVLSLILMMHYLFTRVMTRRIDRMLVAMTQARGGNLQKRMETEPQDELGTIAHGFNEMMDEIERGARERDRLLEEQKGFNVQLQEKVQEATQDLSAANAQLRQLNEDLLGIQRRLTQYERMAVAGQMAATFAHEIGSPLSAISTHLELMAEDLCTNEEARRRLKLIQEQIARITGFVEESLAETRVATQTRLTVQLNQLLKQLLLFLEQHLTKLHVTVKTDFSSDLPEIEANAQQLQQVFLNLLNNACDAMPQGGTVRLKTHTESGAEGQQFVVVSVSDNGIGIPKEKQNRIFEPFFSTKDLRRGTGLGLSIAAKIIQQHEGTIELESEPGVGTAFTIRFRVASRVPQGVALAER